MPQSLRKLMLPLFAGFVLSFASNNLSAQIYTDLHDFSCSTEGCSPQNPAVLAQGRDGKLYGTMTLGGTYNYGTIFSATTDGAVTALYTFDGNLGNGVNSRSGLTLGTDSNFYGTTAAGGTAHGTIFRIPPVQGEIVHTLYSFTGNTASPPYDGGEPYAPPIQGKDGNYYGVTTTGTAYKITASGKFTSLSHLVPRGSSVPLLQASDSKFYGVSSGTVFRLLPLGIVHNFVWAEGVNLHGGVVQSSDGNFYGTASSGGPLGSASGTVFKMTPKGALFPPFHAFDRNNKRNEGYSPYAGLLEATDGNFYGSTQYGGGSCDCGVLFKLTKMGIYSVIHTFDSVQGSVPEAALLQHTNGRIYGLSAGSSHYFTSGVLYSLDVGLAPFVKLMTTQGMPGQTVQILGQDFLGTTDVTFGTGSTNNFTVVLDTFMTAVVPATGTTGYVTVTTPSGTLTSSKIFKVIPVIKSFTPTNGPAGTQVTITGSGFIGTTKVTFGGVKAISYAVDSGTQITATVPTGAKTGKVAVSTPGGTASKGTFTVT